MSIRIKSPLQQQFLFNCVDWKGYQKIGEVFKDHLIRMTYSQGALEVMTPGPTHHRWKHLIGSFMNVIAMESKIDIASFGSMTFKRRDIDRGLEPDECYWIQNELKVRGRDEIDIPVDPPPDLVIEVEVSRGVLDRIALFAALKVPEIWRYDGKAIRVMLLKDSDEYVESKASQALPFLPVAELARFLSQRGRKSETQLLLAFREWVRQQVAVNWDGSAKKKPRKKKS